MTASGTELQLFTLAERQLEIGRPEQALDTLRDADAHDPHTWQLRAAAYSDLDDHRRAWEAAHHGLGLDPDHFALIRLLAAAQLALGDTAKASQTLDLGTRLYPGSPALMIDMANVRMEQGHVEEADLLLERAAGLAGVNSVAILFSRIRLELKLERHERALAYTRRVLEIEPDNARARYLLGAIMAKSKTAWPSEWAPHIRGAARSDPGDRVVTGAAREATYLAHPLMIPLWPIMRFGRWPVWGFGVTTCWLLTATVPPAGGVAFLVWLVYVAYTWVVPRLLEQWIARRR